MKKQKKNIFIKLWFNCKTWRNIRCMKQLENICHIIFTALLDITIIFIMAWDVIGFFHQCFFFFFYFYICNNFQSSTLWNNSISNPLHIKHKNTNRKFYQKHKGTKKNCIKFSKKKIKYDKKCHKKVQGWWKQKQTKAK